MEQHEVDLLSSLPNFLLDEILSLLPTTTAATTSVLSRRWRYLWTHVTRFHFESTTVPTSLDHPLLTILDSVLCRLDSFPYVRNFHLHLRFLDRELGIVNGSHLTDSLLTSWFGGLCGLHTERIEVIHSGEFVQVCVQNSVAAKTIDSAGDDSGLESSDCEIYLPQCVFQSETLTELILPGWFRYNLPEFMILPNLKKLSMRLFDSYHHSLPTCFKSLPLLEDLTLLSGFRSEDNDHLIEISAPNLRIFAAEFDGLCSGVKVLIDAPILKQISISNFGSLFLRFTHIPTALSTAKLGVSLENFLGDDPVHLILELLKGVSCVRSLVIFHRTLKVLNYDHVDALPPFQNLTHLSLVLRKFECTNFDVPTWILTRVKTVEITIWCLKARVYETRQTDHSDMRMLENILSQATALKRLRVSMSDGADLELETLQSENDFVKALFMMPRVSRCKIQFRGLFLRASSKHSCSVIEHLAC